jgi:hypothetical protein
MGNQRRDTESSPERIKAKETLSTQRAGSLEQLAQPHVGLETRKTHHSQESSRQRERVMHPGEQVVSWDMEGEKDGTEKLEWCLTSGSDQIM